MGGTGLLGAVAARQLHDAGFNVRIMARTPDKARAMFNNGYEIVAGDASNLGDVRRALDGCAGVHLSLAERTDLVGTRNVCAAAPDAGIRRITFVSGATVHEKHTWFPMVADKLTAEHAIRDTGIPYTIFAPTWFFEVALNFIRDGRAIMLGQHPRPYHWMAVDDFGGIVARAWQTEAAVNRRFVVFGPEPLLMRDVVDGIRARLHPEINRITTMPLWMAGLMARLTGNDQLRGATELMGYFKKIGVETLGDPSEIEPVLGRPTTTFAQWLDQQPAAQPQPH